MLRTLSVITALQLVTLTSSWACTGQVGATILSDNFANDGGGWDLAPPDVTIQPPNLVIALDPSSNGYNVNNLTFNAIDGDYCMDVVLPPAVSSTNQMYAGINFWSAVDYSSMMNLEVSSSGTVSLAKLVSNNWTTIFQVQNAPGFNSTANAVNSLRVTLLSGTITAYLNGTMVKSVRAQEPTGTLFFGMSGDDDTAVANAPPIKIQGFTVTAGQ
jgi:hypothetical protein